VREARNDRLHVHDMPAGLGRRVAAGRIELHNKKW
jgi:hypothetical protein